MKATKLKKTLKQRTSWLDEQRKLMEAAIAAQKNITAHGPKSQGRELYEF
jgi:hypothetical protein